MDSNCIDDLSKKAFPTGEPISPLTQLMPDAGLDMSKIYFRVDPNWAMRGFQERADHNFMYCGNC